MTKEISQNEVRQALKIAAHTMEWAIEILERNLGEEQSDDKNQKKDQTK